MKKIKIALLFGGKSAEHEVSLRSARNVADAMDKEKYDIVFIGIEKSGRWLLNNSSQLLLNTQNPNLYKLNANSETVTLVPQGGGAISNLSNPSSDQSIDVVFPILHGPFGEDGTVQGLLKLANVPFVGASVLGSAIGVDKDIMKRLLRDAGIPIGKFRTITKKDEANFVEIKEELGLPVFVKPANLGSSVGINKVRDEKEFNKAIDEAFQFDTKVLIEAFIEGREIECSVLGNEDPMASVPGEVIVNDDFYSYNAKYIDEKGATLKIPAELPDKTIKIIQNLAVKTFKTLSCEGLARVDFFLQKDGAAIVNEINTIPGFTNISMYPKLWEASGIGYSELIDRLIQLALERFKKEQRLRTSYTE